MKHLIIKRIVLLLIMSASLTLGLIACHLSGSGGIDVP